MPKARLAGHPLKLMMEFEAAVRAHEMKGAADPEDFAEIEQRYVKAKERLSRKIGQMAADLQRHGASFDNPANHHGLELR